jgi:hypothetical protein
MIIDYDYEFIIYHNLYNYILCYIMQYISITKNNILYNVFKGMYNNIFFQIFRSKVSTAVRDYCLIYAEYPLI